MNAIEAHDELTRWAAQRGEATLQLAMCAAVPQRFETGLLHLLRLNFVPEIGDASGEADVLLAPFCRESAGLYSFEEEVRWLLILYLEQRSQGQFRLREVAEFLLAYLEHERQQLRAGSDRISEAWREEERWSALAFVDPAEAAGQLAAALAKAVEGEGRIGLRFGGLIPVLAQPLAGYPELLAYATGLDALANDRVDEAAAIFERFHGEGIEVRGVRLELPERVRPVRRKKGGGKGHICVIYADEDYDRVRPFMTALEGPGLTVLRHRTSLSQADCVVVFWTKRSVRSELVLRDAHEGRQRGILVSALIDEVELPLPFSRSQAVNLAGRSSSGGRLDELVMAVQRVVGGDSELRAGTTRVNPKDGLTYVWIPPGKFMMGCSPGDKECYDDEKPAREVIIERGFWLGETPVTQAAWKRVMGTDPSRFKGENRPVESITMEEARKYCAAVGGRLPTEAEWEYAARAGSTGARYGELDRIAWYSKNSGEQTHEGKQKEPNAWGLYDMLGNVYEWVEGEQNLRGGGWVNEPVLVRVSYRSRVGPTYRSNDFGFRCGGEVFSL